ncbi:MAG: histidine--tRNA ligase [Patescibacteria group bacterium]|nr:MAG: histidine--tRNA ligase [Patescibacteria group bacterium]
MSKNINRPAKNKNVVVAKKKNDPPSRLKGFRDLIGEDKRYWRLVVDKATQLSKVYDYERLELPQIESLSLFEKLHGKNSEAITKELYSFTDNGNEKVALRHHFKAPLARALMEHLIGDEPVMIKTCLIGPLYRYVKTQSGFYREHRQWNMDVAGVSGPVIDAQLILIAWNFFRELQIDITVEINNLGDEECREAYKEALVEHYKDRAKKVKLPIELKKRLTKDPFSILTDTDERLSEFNEDAPQIVDYLSQEDKENFFLTLEHLDSLNISYNLNPTLFGSFNFYCGTVFEFVTPEEEGRKQQVLGTGGRYSDLYSCLFDKEVPAAGFSVGLDRTVNRLKSLNLPFQSEAPPDVYFAQIGQQARHKAMVMFEELRKSGFSVSQGFLHNGLKGQLEEAEKMQVRFTIILGQKEMMDGTIILRDMESGAQEVVDAKKLIGELEKRMKQ